ncbi:MAG: class II fumarate hydratase [Pseudohongiella sp.]|nr:class II fumarate hydratase [Pseudohongiella sp.]
MDKSYRIETDTQGEVRVPAEALWGAQTQRSLQFFDIGQQIFPMEFIRDFVLLKKAAASANHKLGLLEENLSLLIQDACDDISAGRYEDQFPLSVWQTGSGTQTNMNVNEVIANIANRAAGSALGSKSPVHPNDHVNLSQSSNDVFPTVMHISAMRVLQNEMLPAVRALEQMLGSKAQQFSGTIKIGRTHMMDATPITLGQEFSAYQAQIGFAQQQLEASLPSVATLAIGGTAVGTGLNSSQKWPSTIIGIINQLSGLVFTEAANKFSQLAAHDALTSLHNHLSLLASALYKMASDVRLMNSGPRCGLAEITIPANEPGSSIMPGKVNPTQVEALTMVCVRVMANNTAVTLANSQGQFQLNVYKPLLIITLLESLHLLTDAMGSFQKYCLEGITANTQQLEQYLENSLMLVTALTPEIGYDKAATAAKHALEKNISLKQSIVELQYLSEADFDSLIKPETMLGPNR